MKSSLAQSALPLPVRKGLQALGQNISIARKRRRWTQETVAQRAFVHRNTIARIERGDAGVAIGIYATVLFVFGMADRIGSLVDPATDEVGQALDNDRLPQRARRSASR